MIKTKKIHFFIWTALLLFSCSMFYGITFQAEEEKPNIVWLVSEDNSKHFLKLYEEGGAPMPNIEALAKKGIVFNHAFSNAPVCSVARSTIISGCYAPRVGVQYHRRMELVSMPSGLVMFPYYLRRSGYFTTNNSKQDYNFYGQEGVWDETNPRATYKHRGKDQPFFHVQNFGTTHEGQLHFTKEDMLEHSIEKNVEKIKQFPYHPTTEIFKYTYAKYRQLHQKVDEEIGQFIKELEDEGLMENTIIFYYGDHGGVLPRSKGYVYESGLHVPFVVYIPEKWNHLSPLKKGSRTDAFIEFVDLAPTVLNLAGVEIPTQMDGKAFLGEDITNDKLAKRNTAFAYADRFDEKYDMVRAIRKDNFKYIRNYQNFNIDALFNFYRYKMLAYQEWKELYNLGKLNDVQSQFFKVRSPEMLFDLEKDPHEVQNLASNPTYSNKLTELRLEMQQRVKSMPDLSFYPEPYFLEQAFENPVKFGQANKKEIESLIEVADLSLLPFAQAKEGIESAMNSNNPWTRYWGLIVCSSFGKEAKSFYQKAEILAETDQENLVRTRAIEFLALNDQFKKNHLLVELVKNAKSETEANLILNTIAFLKTVKPDFKIELKRSYFNADWMKNENDLVNRRFDFISH